MNARELKKLLEEGELGKYKDLYADTDKATARYIRAIDEFCRIYGEDRDISVYSVPGRSEISGNHTDHNGGVVLAGAIDKDIIAVASKNEENIIRIQSEGYPESVVDIDKCDSSGNFDNYTSDALIAGTVNGFLKKGFTVGGYDAYATSEVLKGSGISSSAAYEVMIGNILSHLYNEGCVSAEELAKTAQYAENEYFGKPCGLMDQMACAVGGFVYMDFEDKNEPKIQPIDFSLNDYGYSLCIVNTGGNHADLNEDYASVPAEMRSVAKLLGREVLRGLTEEDIVKNIVNIRRLVGDRAVLRALHFIRECARVEKISNALREGNLQEFFEGILASGRSSFQYLQNIYSNKCIEEQGLSLALALTDGYFEGKDAAYRVHGGGFAGTVQVFVKNEDIEEYAAYMDSVFGDGAANAFRIRPKGAVKIF